MSMKNCFQSLCTLLVAICLLSFQALHAQDNVIALSDPVVITDDYEIYGSEISDDYTVASLKVMESRNFDQQKEKEYYFEGTLTEVCQARGCNFVLDDGERHVRVRFKDDSFFIPTNTSGMKSLVRGTFVQRDSQAGQTAMVELLSSAIKIYK